MEDALKESLGIVRAQAGHRVMTGEEILSMIRAINSSLSSVICGEPAEERAVSLSDVKKSIKENSVTCLECGKVMKIITERHLAHHGLNADEYRAKYGMKKGVALASKSLVKSRKKKMAEMKLWERRTKKSAPTA